MTFDYGAETAPSEFVNPPTLHEITAALTNLPVAADPTENLFIETVLNAACAQLLRNYAEVRYPLSGPPRLTNDQLRRAIEYIHENLRESLDLASIAQAAGLSAFHFALLFKERGSWFLAAFTTANTGR